MKLPHIKRSVCSLMLLTLSSNIAIAGSIISAKDAVVVAGSSFNDVDNQLANTYNQAGLYNGYTDKVTDFDSYMLSSPLHTSDYNNQEWFSADSFASVVYDLGSIFIINAVALWNEESAGIKLLDLFGSADGINFFNLASNLMPTDNFFDVNNPSDDYRYGAEVFNFGFSTLRYVRFDMTKCQYDDSSYSFCSIGEVAFRQVDQSHIDVPEPPMLAVLLLGLCALVSRKNSRSKKLDQKSTHGV